MQGLQEPPESEKGCRVSCWTGWGGVGGGGVGVVGMGGWGVGEVGWGGGGNRGRTGWCTLTPTSLSVSSWPVCLGDLSE